MHVVTVNYYFDSELTEPAALLDRYQTAKDTAEHIAALGHRVDVVQRFATNAGYSAAGVEYHFVRSAGPVELRSWHRARPLQALVHRLAPDVVHVHGLANAARARSIARRYPVLVQDHAAAPHLARWRRRLQRTWLDGIDGVMFAARPLADRWIAAGALDPSTPLFEVMEGSTRFQTIDRATSRTRTGLRGEPVLLWVGRLDANKDPLTVLRGFRSVLEHCPGARLYLVYHETEQLPGVTRLLDDHHDLRASVELLGERPHRDLEDIYNSADFFVLGSHHEGSGFALCEAMACGVVPVVTDIPSFRVMTADGQAGGLWRTGDPADFARCLLDTMRTPLPKARDRVHRIFEERLSYDAIARDTVAAYRAVIAQRNGDGS